jgi:hypothetical protein
MSVAEWYVEHLLSDPVAIGQVFWPHRSRYHVFVIYFNISVKTSIVVAAEPKVGMGAIKIRLQKS